MTHKQTLTWTKLATSKFKAYRAISTFGEFEIRSRKSRIWTCWRDGKKLWRYTYISKQQAIAEIENWYYASDEQRQRMLERPIDFVDLRIFNGKDA